MQACSKESLSVLCKAFLRSLLTYTSPGWFPFLSVANITKLERLHRAASRTITGCLSSSPIPLLLSEASLPPLRVTLTRFTLLCYERTLRLPTSFPVSGLARFEVKPRLCRSSWRAFASTHPLMLSSTCLRKALLACPPCPPWNLPSFTVESTYSSSCSPSNPPLSLAKVRLSFTLTLSPLVIWYSVPTALFLFLLAKAALAYSCSIRLQWVPRHSFLPGNDAADELARWRALLAPSVIRCSFSSLVSRIHSSLSSGWRRTVSSKFFDSQVPSISTEELVLPRHACCVLSRLRCNGHSLLLGSYVYRIGRIENSSCSACGHSSQDTFHLILHCPATDSFYRSLFGDSTSSGPGPGQLPGYLGSMVFRHAPIPRKGSGNQQQPQQVHFSHKQCSQSARKLPEVSFARMIEDADNFVIA